LSNGYPQAREINSGGRMTQKLFAEAKVIDMILPIFPLTLLTIALVSIWYYQRTANDIYRVLSAIIAVVCLIWGFAIAHWSVHLLSLVLLYKFNTVSFNSADSGK
jgi:membrane protein YdbS with pleckstrin-like domain